MKKILSVLAVAAVLLPVAAGLAPKSASAASARSADCQYVITACGKTEVQADTAVITVGIESFGLSLADTQEQNIETAKQVSDALAAYGTVQESSFSAYPSYDKKGYSVNTTLQCKTDKIAAVTEIAKAAAQAGATSVYGTNYCVRDVAGAERAALKAAEQEAIAKAASVADGLVLVQLREISCYPSFRSPANGKITYEAYVEAVFVKGE